MYRNDTITADQIVAALYAKHSEDVCFDELRLSSGYSGVMSRVDFLAVHTAPSTGNLAIAYEVKVSRSDFRRDTAKKQRSARLYSDKFFYIAPVGVIPHDDVPDWAGLMEVEWDCYKFKGAKPFLRIRETVKAPKRDKEPPSWGLLISAVRHAYKASSS